MATPWGVRGRRPGLRPWTPLGPEAPDPHLLLQKMGVWGPWPQRGPGAEPLAFLPTTATAARTIHENTTEAAPHQAFPRAAPRWRAPPPAPRRSWYNVALRVSVHSDVCRSC